MPCFHRLYLLISVFCHVYRVMATDNVNLGHCQLGPLAGEIASYNKVVKRIIDYVITGPFKGKTYEELAKFVDKFGSRISGSQTLEDSIDYMIDLTRNENVTDITTERLQVPHWIRGFEKITMIQPRIKNIALLGLGMSVKTPVGGITAEVVIVSSFDELEKLSDADVKGKIVLLNKIFSTYNETVIYRLYGAVRAAKKGALVSLIRSVTPFSLYTPHTGIQFYSSDVKKIPAAAITIEDADLIKRFHDEGKEVVLNIKMSSRYETKMSRNTLVDLKGTDNPEKLVIVSGHIDSWDVGQGAMDDGGGLFISWAAQVILKRLNLTPKRTLRSIFWTAEEFEYIGAYAYEKKHRNDSHNIDFVMESDEGTFAPLGLSVAGNKSAQCIIAEILKLFTSINASRLIEYDGVTTDIEVFIEKGIPGANLYNSNERYFWFHHSEADTMTVEDPKNLDLCTAFWTAVAYVIADISSDIPRTG